MIVPGRKYYLPADDDVTMEPFDGAEIYELVGCYLLSCLTKQHGNGIGLYRGDGLAEFLQNFP